MKNKAAISNAAQHRGDVCYAAAAGPRAIACDIKEMNGRRARAYKRKKKINFISTAFISKTKRDSLLCVCAAQRACIGALKAKITNFLCFSVDTYAARGDSSARAQTEKWTFRENLLPFTCARSRLFVEKKYMKKYHLPQTQIHRAPQLVLERICRVHIKLYTCTFNTPHIILSIVRGVERRLKFFFYIPCGKYMFDVAEKLYISIWQYLVFLTYTFVLYKYVPCAFFRIHNMRMVDVCLFFYLNLGWTYFFIYKFIIIMV